VIHAGVGRTPLHNAPFSIALREMQDIDASHGTTLPQSHQTLRGDASHAPRSVLRCSVNRARCKRIHPALRLWQAQGRRGMVRPPSFPGMSR
jgi:hypothetical protein